MKKDNIYWAEDCLKKRRELMEVLEFDGADCDLRITVVSRDGDVVFTADCNDSDDMKLQRDIYKALQDRLQVVDKYIEEL